LVVTEALSDIQETSCMKLTQLKTPLFGLILVLVGIALVEPLRSDNLPVVRVLAAGSLRSAIDEIGAAFSSASGVRIESGFGPSGILRERIEKGEGADLFASADMGNPLVLSRAGKAGPVILFARNRLCAVARPGLSVTPDNLLSTLLDPAVKLGTSTPKADPAGDYTWAMFAKAEAVRPGSRAVLEAKALQLMGGSTSAAPPAGIGLFAWHLREGRADVFLAYCSAGASFRKDLPGAAVVNLPSELATGADYGLTLLSPKNEYAAAFALFILSQDGQNILARNGFDAPLLTREQQ
jgi:ABC-type molybdate transport system substrate-binding protein